MVEDVIVHIMTDHYIVTDHMDEREEKEHSYEKSKCQTIAKEILIFFWSNFTTKPFLAQKLSL